MMSECKTACILMDENDLNGFRNSYGYAASKECLHVPFDYISLMQVIFHESEVEHYIPKTYAESDLSIAKTIYADSQKFLKQLLLSNKIVDETEDSFPLEFFWFRLWSCVYRIISFCNDLLAQHPVKEVVLIKRSKSINTGGLLLDTASLTELVKTVFIGKDTKVKVLEHREHYIKPQTILYDQKYRLKTSLKTLSQLFFWKALSFNKKNYDLILVNAFYDNVINCYKAYGSAKNMSPQVFRSGRMPFLHSWRKTSQFLIDKFFPRKNHPDNTQNIVKPYEISLQNIKFDFAKIFHSTIVQYLNDTRRMSNYINMFWDKYLEKGKRYLTIFSMSPSQLDSYYMIKKTRECDGKLAIWQHGGSYGYVDYFQHYISDYKNADYFLSFGKSNINEITKYMGNKSPACVEVGSNLIYGKSMNLNNLRIKRSWDSQGLFIPVVAATFHSQDNFKWRMDTQFGAMKQIIDFFGSDEIGKIIIKGLKNHRPHLELRRYIKAKRYRDVSYSDIPVDNALSNNPKFVIIDNTSTPLLTVLAQYTGPIFLMVNQKSWAVREDALALLKRRVVYSESVDELKKQLTNFSKTGIPENVDVKDTSFVDVYLKRFCYQNYERFLQEAMPRRQQ